MRYNPFFSPSRSSNEARKTARGNPYLQVARRDAERYERARHLPPLLALWPQELADHGVEGTKKIIARLERALREERQRGRAGHWCYDLNRHAGLISALEGERAHLRALTSSS